MRFALPAAALLLFAVQASAQTTAPITSAPLTAPAPATPAPAAAPAPASAAPASAAPAAAAPATTPKATAKKHSQTLQQRFDAANTTHDGHLTKDQATAAKWGYVTSSFSKIDKDHKGYVTVEDIRGYAKTKHATKTKTKAPAAAAPAAPATNN